MRWASVPEYPDYEVSDAGYVRRATDGPRLKKHGVLKAIKNAYGYDQVGLYEAGVRKVMRIHRIVVSSFVGPIPDGMQINHINGIRDDNRLENLEIVTPAENVRDQMRKRPTNFPDRRGDKNQSAKISADDARAIRDEYEAGRRTQAEIAWDYGITQNNVSKIVRKRTWKHL